MNMRKIQMLVAALAGSTLGACAHNQAQVPTAPLDHPIATAPAPAAKPAAEESRPNEDLDKMLRGEVLHFDFDRADLTAESRERLQRIAEILTQHPKLTIRIEGNCDERGGEEFNLQLGQERAAAARKYLANLGVNPSRIDTISYGKDRPSNPAHTPDAWSENRRDDIHEASASR
jgi:peptidoglycan-associated lipoprotein